MENLSNLRSGMNSAYRAVRGTLICLLLTWVPGLKLFAAFGIWFCIFAGLTFRILACLPICLFP